MAVTHQAQREMTREELLEQRNRYKRLWEAEQYEHGKTTALLERTQRKNKARRKALKDINRSVLAQHYHDNQTRELLAETVRKLRAARVALSEQDLVIENLREQLHTKTTTEEKRGFFKRVLG